MSGDALHIAQARSLLGLSTPFTPQALSAAFRVAVKAARPDIPGGDVVRFRQVIDAYHLLQNQPLPLPAPATPAPSAPFAAPPPPRPALVLTPLQAVTGSPVRLRLGQRTLQIRVPAGLRSNDQVRLKGLGPAGQPLHLPVLIRPAEGLTVLGSDLFMDWPVPARMIRDGGRIEIQTHAGLRHAWLVPDMPQPTRLRLKGLGLPARGSRPAGDLFVRLEPTDDQVSAAQDMLRRFTQVWTPKPLAA